MAVVRENTAPGRPTPTIRTEASCGARRFSEAKLRPSVRSSSGAPFLSDGEQARIPSREERVCVEDLWRPRDKVCLLFLCGFFTTFPYGSVQISSYSKILNFKIPFKSS